MPQEKREALERIKNLETLIPGSFVYGMLVSLSFPRPATERGCVMTYLISFLVAIVAEVVGHYICKWLDSDSNDN